MATCVMRPIEAIGLVVATLVALSDAGIGAPLNIAGANDCLSAPNSPASAGEHWYYHTDWTKHRNCWYLRTQSARQTNAQPTSEVTPAVHAVLSKPPATAGTTPSIADRIKKTKEMITAKLGNPSSIKFPDIAPGKAIDSVCGEAEVRGAGETREMPFAVQKNKVFIINGSDDLRASTAIHKMCD
jgi:hypothetical protein